MNRLIAGLLVSVGLAHAASGCTSGALSPRVQASVEAKLAEKTRGLTCHVRGEFSEDLRYGFLKWAIHDEVPARVRRAFIVYGAIATIGGSGFPVWTDGKRTWISTNAHVLEEVDSEVVLTFDAGETNLNGKVVYIDTRRDIGFVEVSRHLPLVRLRSGIHEHMPVFAAGYPEGSYRITPGRVSNRCLRLSELEGSMSDDCWIEHTAAIDPGSSGGPVFAELGQDVVGMNTLFAPWRNDLFLALPAPVIQERLAVALKGEKISKTAKGRRDSLRQSCHEFMAELDSSLAREGTLNRVLSDELVIEKGLDALRWVKKEEKISDSEMEFLLGYYPYEAIRHAVMLKLKEDAERLGGLKYDERCENINPADDLMDDKARARIMVRFEKARVETAWRFDRGSWRLSYVKPRFDDKADEPVSTEEALEGVFGGEQGEKCPATAKPGACPENEETDEGAKPEGGDKQGLPAGGGEDKPKTGSPDPNSTDDCVCVEDEQKGECRCDCGA